jgi:hypothetical protein
VLKNGGGFFIFTLQKGVATINEKNKKIADRLLGSERLEKTMTKTAKSYWRGFFIGAAVSADNLAQLHKGYRTKWYSPQ